MSSSESDVADYIAELLLGGDDLLSRDQIIATLGIEDERAAKIWNGFGFPRVDPGAPVMRAADVQSLSMLAAVDEADPGSVRMEVAMARAVGQAMSRLADWEATFLASVARRPQYAEDLPQLIAALERVHVLVWRRHLVGALRGALAAPDAEQRVLTVGFADLVGYTSLSRRLGISELGEMLEVFGTNAHEAVIRGGGSVVKTLGDEVMFTAESPTAAATIALELRSLPARFEVPELRVGVAHGDVLIRYGDVYGEPVNIAARLTSSARPGTILVDKLLGDVLAADDQFRLRSIPPLSVRGYRRLHARALDSGRG